MLAMLAMLAIALRAAEAADATPRMAELYEEACLKAFPDDAALDRLMAGVALRPLTAAEARVTLNEDPGRGWLFRAAPNPVFVFVELPPFHACSVRWVLPEGKFDLGEYRPVAERYKASHPGFVETREREGDVGAIHVHSLSEGRNLPGGGAETLMVFDQHAADPTKRSADGATMSLRFVHQIVTGRSTPASLNARNAPPPRDRID